MSRSGRELPTILQKPEKQLNTCQTSKKSYFRITHFANTEGEFCKLSFQLISFFPQKVNFHLTSIHMRSQISNNKTVFTTSTTCHSFCSYLCNTICTVHILIIFFGELLQQISSVEPSFILNNLALVLFLCRGWAELEIFRLKIERWCIIRMLWIIFRATYNKYIYINFYLYFTAISSHVCNLKCQKMACILLSNYPRCIVHYCNTDVTGQHGYKIYWKQAPLCLYF